MFKNRVACLTKNTLLLAMLLFGLSACASLFFDNRTITKGEFEGFEIGDSKATVLAAIRRLPAVTGMNADPPHRFYAYAGHMEGIAWIREADKLAVTTRSSDRHASYAKFQFINGISKLMEKPATDVPPNVLALENRTLKDFQARLEDVLNDVHFSVAAYPILSDDLPKKVLFEQGDAALAKFADVRDGWGIFNRQEKPIGAALVFYFEQGKLNRIDYSRTRTSLDIFP